MAKTIFASREKIGSEIAAGNSKGNKRNFPATYIVKVTDVCNLRCHYCSFPTREQRFLPLELWKTFLRGLRRAKEAEGDETPVTFIFHGGEPLLWGHVSLEKAFKAVFSELAGYRVRLSLQTNGTVTLPGIFSLLKDYEVSLGISLDGPKDLHDLNRCTPSGEGSFYQVQRTLEELDRHNIPCAFLAVITPDHLGHEERFWRFFKGLGYPVKISPVSPLGRAQRAFYGEGEESRWFSRFLLRLYEVIMADEEGFLEDFISVHPLESLLQSVLQLYPGRECTFLENCACHFFCFDFEGRCSPCGRLTHIIYGKFPEQSLEDILFSEKFPAFKTRATHLKQSDCQDCRFFSFCYGGCPATAIKGNPLNKTVFCEDWRYLFDYFSTSGLDLLHKRLVQDLSRIREFVQKLKLLQNFWQKRK